MIGLVTLFSGCGGTIRHKSTELRQLSPVMESLGKWRWLKTGMWAVTGCAKVAFNERYAKSGRYSTGAEHKRKQQNREGKRILSLSFPGTSLVVPTLRGFCNSSSQRSPSQVF